MKKVMVALALVMASNYARADMAAYQGFDDEMPLTREQWMDLEKKAMMDQQNDLKGESVVVESQNMTMPQELTDEQKEQLKLKEEDMAKGMQAALENKQKEMENQGMTATTPGTAEMMGPELTPEEIERMKELRKEEMKKEKAKE